MIATRTRVLLSTPIGESIRNVLRNDTWTVLRNREDIELIVAVPTIDQGFIEEFGGPRVTVVALPVRRPTRRTLGALAAYAAVLADRTRTMAVMIGGGGEPARTAAGRLRPLVRIAATVVGVDRVRLALMWWVRRIGGPSGCEELFDRMQPDLVVVSRPFGFPSDHGVLVEAARRNLPALVLLSSWDNLSSKPFLPVWVRCLVVWNDELAHEATSLHGIPAERVVVAGIPRYDGFFRREGLRNREDFCRAHGLDPARPFITYCTGTREILRTPDGNTVEGTFVQDLRELIQGPLARHRPQLLIRLHPQADLAHYTRFADCDGVVITAPGSHRGLLDRDLSITDERTLGETMWHSAAVVNVASTTTIDAAVFDTPAVCIGYDPQPDVPFEHSVRRFYEFDHYRKLQARAGVRVAAGRNELGTLLDRYLVDPSADSDVRRAIVAMQCGPADGMAGHRVAQAIIRQMPRGA